GVVYSPPTNFTRNGHSYSTTNTSDSTNLRIGYEAAFAQYMADILQHFQTNSDPAEQVTFNYISPFNEPYWDWNSPSQEGNRAANSDIINEVIALSSALTLRGLPTQIQLAEAGDIPGLYQQRSDTSSR